MSDNFVKSDRNISNPLEGLVEEGEELELKVEISRILYPKKGTAQDGSGYTVFSASNNKYGNLNFSGVMANAYVGGIFTIRGTWTKNKYGFQVAILSYEEEIPKDAKGILLFLQGNIIKGLGKTYAERVVKKFGEKTFEVIDAQPDRLLEVSGIGEKRKNMIVESWKANKDIRDIMIFFRNNGVTEHLATKFYKQYGSETIDTIKKNPYCIINDIYGVGFKKADEIALQMGYQKDGYNRISNGISYTLDREASSGHCYLDEATLATLTGKLLGLPASIISGFFPELEKEKHVIRFMDIETKLPSIACKPIYDAEESIAKNVVRLMYGSRNVSINADKEIKRILRKAKKAKVEYDEGQIEAIRAAFLNKFMIITGGPGTGKTTIMREIIEAFEKNRASVKLAAPTGRAAKQMTIATGREAMTLHRLLKLTPGERYEKSSSGEESAKPNVDADVLIVDESSMINAELAATLLEAVSDTTTLIMVGDIDQLPAIGAGNVLKDMIESEVVVCKKLTKIFRQAGQSRIIKNAYRINNGECPETTNKMEDDYLRQRTKDDRESAKTIVDLVTEVLPRVYGTSPKDIQVLCPQKKGTIGTFELNIAIRNVLNGKNKKICNNERGGFYIGDKVMQMTNDYDKNVFNGDIGYITKYDEDEQVAIVDFDGNEIEYDINDMDELMLAYAITVHKSQGNEFHTVVMPLSMSNRIMLQRNLFYTALTRAKKLFIAIGDKNAEFQAVRCHSQEIRNTRLKWLLRSCIR